MARMMTSYVPVRGYDEEPEDVFDFPPFTEDEQKAFAHLSGEAPPPTPTAPLPAAEPPPPFAPSPALRGRNTEPGGDVHVYEPPAAAPSSSGGFGDDAGMMLALLADMAINKGRGGADIIKWYQGGPQRDLDARYKEAQIANLNAQATRPGGGKGPSPEQLELQRQRIDLARERLGQSQGKTDRQLALLEREKDIGSDETREAQDALIASGYDESKARQMTAFQIYKFRPQLGQRSSQSYGQQLWGERFDAEQQAQLGKERRGEARDIRGEERGEERGMAKEDRELEVRRAERAQDFKDKFLKERGTELDIAALVQDVEKTPGGVPPTFWERFSSQLTARGIPKERLQSWQAKKMILEIWSRSQSGAAISGTEDGKFLNQVGSDPLASPDSVEAAYSVLKNVVGRRLRAGSSADKQSAREIGDEYGLDNDAWFGTLPGTQLPRPSARKPKAAPKSAPVNADDDEWEDI